MGRGVTLAIELHSPQPLYAGRHDLFRYRICLCVVSIYFAPFLLTAKLSALTAKLREIVKP